MKPRILLIDLSALFHPAWRANENGPVSVAFEGTIGGVRRCIAAAGEGALVAVCCDGRGNWRKELAKDYKAHRDPLPSVFYAEFDRVKQRLRDDGLLLWQADGFEADDLIATAVAAAREAGCEGATIATHDKDMFQLVGVGVDVLSLSSWERRDAEAVEAKFGVKPEQIGDWLALVGDASDGVKGAPGIGPKTATKLLAAYGNLAGVFKAAYDLKSDLTPAIRKSLTDNGEQIELARKLVSMRTDAPINFADIYEKREQKPLTEVEDDMPHDLGSIQDAMEDRATAVHQAVQGLGGAELGPPSVEGGKELAPMLQAEFIKPAYTTALEPRTFSELLTACKVLFNSRLYQKYKSPEAMAAVVMRGREMGYGMGASLDGFHVISQTGQLAMHAHMIIDRAKSHPDCDWFQCVETDATHAVYKTKNKRNPSETTLTYTIEQAIKAGLIRDGGNWRARPDEMIRKTCGVQLARMEYPGAAMGLHALFELGEDE
jgi:5'-3' exonuclease